MSKRRNMSSPSKMEVKSENEPRCSSNKRQPLISSLNPEYSQHLLLSPSKLNSKPITLNTNSRSSSYCVSPASVMTSPSQQSRSSRSRRSYRSPAAARSIDRGKLFDSSPSSRKLFLRSPNRENSTSSSSSSSRSDTHSLFQQLTPDSHRHLFADRYIPNRKNLNRTPLKRISPGNNSTVLISDNGNDSKSSSSSSPSSLSDDSALAGQAISVDSSPYSIMLQSQLLPTSDPDVANELLSTNGNGLTHHDLHHHHLGPSGSYAKKTCACSPTAPSNCSEHSITNSNKQDGSGLINNHNGHHFWSQAPRTLRFKSSLVSPSPLTSQLISMASPRTPQLTSPIQNMRSIPKHPFKILDAPQLQDDFYLNLLDWSSQNVVAVGLGTCVYLWSASTSKVHELCDLKDESDSVASVGWCEREHGHILAIGTDKGNIHLWDTYKCQKLRTLPGHTNRVVALSWNDNMLASGSRDCGVLLRDVRASEHAPVSILRGHEQEVCGLKWSYNKENLASGGNDNRLLIWSLSNLKTPILKYEEHTAAIKAITWSPHEQGLLASGGGTADRTIRIWNTLSESRMPVHCVDSGSQVCNILWSKNVNRIVSTHGYSLNQIMVWQYPSMKKLTTLTGHTYRVLYLSISPDGQTIVTGAGDETLRFWNVFPSTPRNNSGIGSRFYFPKSPEIR